jgi:hypothetical protein
MPLVFWRVPGNQQVRCIDSKGAHFAVIHGRRSAETVRSRRGWRVRLCAIAMQVSQALFGVELARRQVGQRAVDEFGQCCSMTA